MDPKMKALHSALQAILSMLDDSDVRSSEHLRNPASQPDDTGAVPDDATDASLLADDKPEAGDALAADEGEPQAEDQDDGMLDELAEMTAKGHPGAAGAMDIFKKEKPEDEDDEDEG